MKALMIICITFLSFLSHSQHDGYAKASTKNFKRLKTLIKLEKTRDTSLLVKNGFIKRSDTFLVSVVNKPLKTTEYWENKTTKEYILFEQDHILLAYQDQMLSRSETLAVGYSSLHLGRMWRRAGSYEFDIDLENKQVSRAIGFDKRDKEVIFYKDFISGLMVLNVRQK